MVASNGRDEGGTGAPASGSPRRKSTAPLRRALRDLLHVQARFRKEPVRYLMVLGHMRSGSSLLVHLLASHPEIAGLGESWLRYGSRAALGELVVWVHAELRRPFLTETYVLDKVLHDDLIEDDTVLGSRAVTSMVIVRGAERTLQSLFANRQRLAGIVDWESAARYYERRLERLAAEARLIDDPRRCLFVPYETLVDRPKATLEAMTRFLGLGSPLVERYRVTSRTGTAGLGDFGEHITSGAILKTPAPDVDVPADVLERGHAAHSACVRELGERCASVEPSNGHATVT